VPQLSESVMIEAVKLRFRSFNITLPTVVTTTPPNVGLFLLQSRQTAISGLAAPSMGAINVSSSTTAKFKIGGGVPAPPRLTGTPQNVPPALVRAASNDKVDVDFQTQANNELSNYITAICHTIVGAHDDWRYKAFLRGVQILGPVASGGNISGPLLSVNMNMYGPQQGAWGNAGAYTRAIADGIASCWRDWEQSVRVPALPWYPAFIGVAMPVAPPTPNIPTPVGTLTSSPTALTPDTLKTTISRKLAQPGPYSDELFASVAAGFVAALAPWFLTQLVGPVFGKGPVPTFAPPYVPVGPVVGGSIIEASPHFAT